MNTDIAVEAWEEIRKLTAQYNGMFDGRAIIQSAIEKATKELQDANDNLFKVARKHSVENTKLRAAQASASEADTWTREKANTISPLRPAQANEWEKYHGDTGKVRIQAHASEALRSAAQASDMPAEEVAAMRERLKGIDDTEPAAKASEPDTGAAGSPGLTFSDNLTTTKNRGETK